jgi:hypothetical protein
VIIFNRDSLGCIDTEVESEDTPAVSPRASEDSEPEVTASRTLTARQMALASGAEVEHVSLGKYRSPA